VQVGEVRISVASHGKRLDIAIDDDGPGLPAGERDSMFGRGVRADERIQGSGLGLGIVRELAQLYGGEVELAESPAGGLRARLVLPAA
jgi:signal transduction histidine kinase